jgi:hypothetical protein
MVEICSILDEEMAEVEIIAMKPDDIVPVEANLTKIVQDNFPKLIEKVLQTVKSSGIELVKKDKEITLKQIIKEYANPTQQIHI